MSFKFDIKKAIHLILYILNSHGGSLEPLRIFQIIYLADLRYLKRYGGLISGDLYVAFKNGPAPLQMYLIYKQISDIRLDTSDAIYCRNFLGYTNENKIKTLKPNSSNLLNASEVECLFEVIQEVKKLDKNQLESIILKNSNFNNLVNNDISLNELALLSGASEEMLLQIEQSYNNEIFL